MLGIRGYKRYLDIAKIKICSGKYFIRTFRHLKKPRVWRYSNILIAERKTAKKSYTAHVDINKRYSLTVVIAKYFHAAFLEDLRYKCFPTRLLRRARSSPFVRSEEKESSEAFTLLPPLTRPLPARVEGDDIGVECFYSITPVACDAILLTTYLTHDLWPCLPLVRAWWPSKTQILSVVRSRPCWERVRPGIVGSREASCDLTPARTISLSLFLSI